MKNDHLRNKNLHLSGRECLILNYFSLFVSDLIPNNDKVMKYMVILEETVELLLSESFTSLSVSLKEQISYHNQFYVKVFGPTLKPKHHLLLHYPTIILESGPIKHLWCMRFESKHRELKNYINVNSCKRNLSFSVGKKTLLKLAYKILQNSQFEPDIISFKLESGNKCDYKNYISTLNIPIHSQENVKQVELINYKGTTFKKGFYIQDNLTNFIFKIIFILIQEENVYFIVQKIKIKNFDTILRAFIIGEAELKYNWFLLNTKFFKPAILYKTHNFELCFKKPFL